MPETNWTPEDGRKNAVYLSYPHRYKIASQAESCTIFLGGRIRIEDMTNISEILDARKYKNFYRMTEA